VLLGINPNAGFLSLNKEKDRKEEGKKRSCDKKMSITH